MAEAAAVLTIDAALAAEGSTPEAMKTEQPMQIETAPQPLTRITATPEAPTPIVIVVTATQPPAANTATIPEAIDGNSERETLIIQRLRLRQDNGDPIFAYHREQSPTIDGYLREWTTKSYSIDNPVFRPENWQGWRDLSGTFFIAWDVDNLYLGVEVIDDLHVQNARGRTLYQGDDVEIQFDAQLQTDFADPNLSEDDYQIGLSAGNFIDRPPEAYVWLPGERDGTMIDLAARQIANGYVLEAAIPWWVLGTQPQAETAYGFALSLTDNDTPGTSTQETLVSTSPNRTVYSNPTLLGNLVLLDLE